MKKTYMSREQIMQECGYSAQEFAEYYGAQCIGTIIYENSGETLYEVCVCFDGNKITYRFDEIGTWSTTYNSLEEFEADWL